MKRIVFVLPVESMRGNLSGEQNLVYAQNNNPAYEAPNGTQYARNYQGRYIGAKVSRTGMKYFAVKTKSATVLDAQSRLTMATLAGVAAIRSALMKDHASDYAQIIANLTADIAQGIVSGTGKRTIMALFFEKVSGMLQGHQPTLVFSGTTPVTIHNPWDVDSSDALDINPALWLKYADIFAFSDNNVGGYYFQIAGRKYFAMWTSATGHTDQYRPDWVAWFSALSTNINARLSMNFSDTASGSGIFVDEDAVTVGGESVKYNGTPVVGRADKVIVNGKYTL